MNESNRKVKVEVKPLEKLATHADDDVTLGQACKCRRLLGDNILDHHGGLVQLEQVDEVLVDGLKLVNAKPRQPRHLAIGGNAGQNVDELFDWSEEGSLLLAEQTKLGHAAFSRCLISQRKLPADNADRPPVSGEHRRAGARETPAGHVDQVVGYAKPGRNVGRAYINRQGRIAHHQAGRGNLVAKLDLRGAGKLNYLPVVLLGALYEPEASSPTCWRSCSPTTRVPSCGSTAPRPTSRRWPGRWRSTSAAPECPHDLRPRRLRGGLTEHLRRLRLSKRRHGQ